MEHLTIHLPTESELGGMVQFRWMYQFKRFMFHLKKKAKNKANVEGSIVEQFINEEITNFTSHYYATLGDHLSNRAAIRHAVGYVQQTPYSYQVPAIFRHVGSGSGETYFQWLSEIDIHIAHTYILLNCEELQQYEGLFDDYARVKYRGINDNLLPGLREREYSGWLREYVESDYTHTLHPLWLQELVRGPTIRCTCWNAFFVEVITFIPSVTLRTKEQLGVCVRGSSENEVSFYGKLQDVIQLDYNCVVGLKVTLFRCDWYDTTWGTGTRMCKSGVFEVDVGGVYNKYDPFILTTQADQVS